MKCIYNKSHKNHKKIIFIFFLFVLFISSIYLIFHFVEKLSLFPEKSINEESIVYYFLMILATYVLALTTFLQFTKLNKNLDAEYLLKVDERWSSKEILKARLIIHDLYLKHQIENNSPREILHDTIGRQILIMSKEKNNKEQKKFIYILNFLDFMETIGYLSTQGNLNLKDVSELFGNSLTINYEIFSPYIKYTRSFYNQRYAYKEFEKLYNHIKKIY